MDKKIDMSKFTKEEAKLVKELLELSKTTKVRPKRVNSFGSYQIIVNNKDEEQ